MLPCSKHDIKGLSTLAYLFQKLHIVLTSGNCKRYTLLAERDKQNNDFS